MAEDSLTARNRINQRNFRARRQNYIKDLEERLRKYESEGVQATIEIQSVARQVTEQNVKLRSLLTARFGMDDHEIDGYLGVTNQPSLSTIFSTPALSNPASKPFLEHRSSSFASIPPHSDVSPQNGISSSVMSPALGLASLHKLPEHTPTNSDLEYPNKKQCRDKLADMSISTLTMNRHSTYPHTLDSNSSNPEPEQDTLSESSNPQTPADHLDSMLRHSFTHLNQSNNTTHQNSANVNGAKSHNHNRDHNHNESFNHNYHNSQPAPQSLIPQFDPHSNPRSHSHSHSHSSTSPKQDETSCEDAARIIASMRGTTTTSSNPETILIELGCRITPQGNIETLNGSRSCKVKNLSLFQLMDGEGVRS